MQRGLCGAGPGSRCRGTVGDHRTTDGRSDGDTEIECGNIQSRGKIDRLRRIALSRGEHARLKARRHPEGKKIPYKNNMTMVTV